MVCPKCGMKVTGSRSECKFCGAPIPAEMGGDRPDPIYDDAYDWLRADEIHMTAVQTIDQPELAPRRDERERLKQEKTERRERLKRRLGVILLLCMLATVLAVLAILAGIYFSQSRVTETQKQSESTVQSTSPTYLETESSSLDPGESIGLTENAQEETAKKEHEKTAEDAQEETVEDSGEYILPDSDSRKLNREDLEGLTHEQCCLARNEIYARHGRVFLTAAISEYFKGQSWYEPLISGDDFSEEGFNSFERFNIDFIGEYELEKWGSSFY